MKKKEPTETRVTLTREIVLRAALKLIDETGLESLSMRVLGAKLGVEAMSLYNHVRNKDDIIDGVLDLVIGEIIVPTANSAWRKAMKERAVSALDAFNRHSWASALMDSRVSSSPARLNYFENIIGTLCNAGFSLKIAAHAFSVLDCYIYGFGLQKHNKTANSDDTPETQAEAFHKNIPEKSYPYVTQLSELASKKGYDERADFEFGLTLILDGLERMIVRPARK